MSLVKHLLSRSEESLKRQLSFPVLPTTSFGGRFDEAEKGIEEGLYRPELKVDLIAASYVLRTEQVLNLEEYYENAKYTSSDVFEELLEYHIRGISTAKGIKCFEKIRKNEKSKQIKKEINKNKKKI